MTYLLYLSISLLAFSFTIIHVCEVSISVFCTRQNLVETSKKNLDLDRSSSSDAFSISNFELDRDDSLNRIPCLLVAARELLAEGVGEPEAHSVQVAELPVQRRRVAGRREAEAEAGLRVRAVQPRGPVQRERTGGAQEAAPRQGKGGPREPAVRLLQRALQVAQRPGAPHEDAPGRLRQGQAQVQHLRRDLLLRHHPGRPQAHPLQDRLRQQLHAMQDRPRGRAVLLQAPAPAQQRQHRQAQRAPLPTRQLHRLLPNPADGHRDQAARQVPPAPSAAKGLPLRELQQSLRRCWRRRQRRRQQTARRQNNNNINLHSLAVQRLHLRRKQALLR